eukprot:13843075-Ditylum_brightwellii.AAC.1
MAGIRNNLPSLLEAFLPHFSQMEGNSIAMAASTPAPCVITISSSPSVASCFLVTDAVAKLRLEKSIKGAASLMSMGCVLQSGLGFVGLMLPTSAATTLASTTSILPSTAT